MTSSIFDWFRSRTRQRSREAREEDVRDTLYQHRNIELFPKDLNADYNPWDFYDEPVEPKSFRNQITSALAWTVGVPLLLFLVLQQESMKRTTAMLDQREQIILKAVESSAAEALKALPRTLTTVSQLQIQEYGADLHPDRLLQTLQLRHPVEGLLIERPDEPPIVEGGISLEHPEALAWREVDDRLSFALAPSSTEAERPQAGARQGLLFRLVFPEAGIRIIFEMDPASFLARLWKPYGGFNFSGALYARDGRLITSLPEGLPAELDLAATRAKLVGNSGFWSYGPQFDQVYRSATIAEPFGWYVVVDHPLRDRYAELNNFIATSGLLFILKAGK